MSRLAGPSTRSILYCNPEQPPPMTATRSAPWGRPCRCSNCESFAAALPVTFTKRSFPILYFTSVAAITREYGSAPPKSKRRERRVGGSLENGSGSRRIGVGGERVGGSAYRRVGVVGERVGGSAVRRPGNKNCNTAILTRRSKKIMNLCKRRLRRPRHAVRRPSDTFPIDADTPIRRPPEPSPCLGPKSRFGERSMPDPRRFRTELLETLVLACPIMAGQVGQMLMGLVDTVMVGHVGTGSLAAAAFANCLMSVAFVFGIGILTSVGVLASQAHGAGMDRHKRVILRSSIWLSVMIGVVVASVLTLVQPWLSVFQQPQAVLAQAKPFIAILSWSLVPALVFISSKSFSEALSRPLVPALMMYLGVALNVFLNWVLIFGNLGAPALGLVGAGWATFISRIVVHDGYTPFLHTGHGKWFLGSACRTRSACRRFIHFSDSDCRLDASICPKSALSRSPQF